jgi:hypothetical protein
MWSVQAVALSYWTKIPLDEEAKDLRIPAPDKRIEAQVRPDGGKDEGMPEVRIYRDGILVGKPITVFAHPELLWAPDSKAFTITSTGGGLVGNWQTTVYQVGSDTITPVNASALVRRDLSRNYPPCFAYRNNPQPCTTSEIKRMRQTLDWINVAAIKWIDESQRLLVVAQVPCSSGYGKNMCEYVGYEIAVPSGRILGRYRATEFQKRFGRFCGSWPHNK